MTKKKQTPERTYKDLATAYELHQRKTPTYSGLGTLIGLATALLFLLAVSGGIKFFITYLFF
jgi:hypothetical protein